MTVLLGDNCYVVILESVHEFCILHIMLYTMIINTKCEYCETSTHFTVTDVMYHILIENSYYNA